MSETFSERFVSLFCLFCSSVRVSVHGHKFRRILTLHADVRAWSWFIYIPCSTSGDSEGERVDPMRASSSLRAGRRLPVDDVDISWQFYSRFCMTNTYYSSSSCRVDTRIFCMIYSTCVLGWICTWTDPAVVPLTTILIR